MTAKDKAEILAKKASCSYWTDSSCKTVANHILKVIPLTELLAVATAASGLSGGRSDMKLHDQVIYELKPALDSLRANLPKGIEL